MLPPKQVITRLPPDVFRLLKDRAEQAGKSTYAFAREALIRAAGGELDPQAGQAPDISREMINPA